MGYMIYLWPEETEGLCFLFCLKIILYCIVLSYYGIESIHTTEDQFDPRLTNLMILFLAQICKVPLVWFLVCLLLWKTEYLCPGVLRLIAKDLTLSSVTLKWMIIKTVSVLTQSLLYGGDKHNVFFQVLESRITETMISKEIK